ncbi:Epn2 [Symbiodinium pilosum]|uniref:Epn2 protein n=1 Tax=Symbiodinium pilosum TaxID=2952 RepID=A0A812W7L6_SYMPI|nr:Epn2 [Symbiodinium pilosum]
MPGGPGLTAADHILWAQRIQKEEINAKSRPDAFSVRAAVSVPGVPTKFKPGHMDPREASGSGFSPAALGWDPASTMTTEFRRCMNQQSAGPRERHLFPETSQQEIGWIQGNCGKPAQRSAPAGSEPTRLGVGWLMKDGHGGPINKLAAERADDAPMVLSTERQHPRNRKSKDGNVREELGVPPYATSISCAIWPDDSPAEESVGNRSSRSSRSHRSKSQSKLQVAGRSQMHRAGSQPTLQESVRRHFAVQEQALGQAMDRSRKFLNCPTNRWYQPLSNSDVAKFADAYTKAFGVGLYARG